MHAHRLLGGQCTVAWVADGWEWFVCKETVWNFAVGCVVGLHGKMVLMLQDRFVRKGPCCNLAACVRVQLSLKNREWREEQTPKLAVEENGGRTKDHTWCTADFTIPCSHQQTPLFPCWTSSSSVNETRVLTYGFLCFPSLSLSLQKRVGLIVHYHTVVFDLRGMVGLDVPFLRDYCLHYLTFHWLNKCT